MVKEPKRYSGLKRLPAEWEPVSGVLMAWPHAGSEWDYILAAARKTHASIGAAISQRATLLLAVADDMDAARKALLKAGANPDRLRLYACPLNDTWARDFGPLTIVDAKGKPNLLDFGFNGWGLKFRSDLDNRITRLLHAAGAFGNTPLDTVGLVLEGGSIESDGSGTLLTTAACLLSPNRNPHLGQAELTAALKAHFGARQVHWLQHGHLEGDDTDAHIDTLARLCPDDTIAYVACMDRGDSHYIALQAMVRELKELRTTSRKPYRLVPLPWPTAIYDEDGQRLPATYANFLVVNGAVLVPTYNQLDNDRAALKAVGKAFPGYDIVGIDCRTLIRQHGSLHCVTMQIPEGVVPT